MKQIGEVKLLGYYLALLLVAAMVLLSGCRTCRQTQSEVERVEHHSSDTLHDVRLRVDSVVIRDSVSTYVKGDSVIITRWRDRTAMKLRVDTVEKERVRTVYQTRNITQTQEVEKELSWWQRVLMWIGVGAIVSVLVWVWMRVNR